MIKRFHHHRQADLSRQYRVNERIFANTLRVLDSEGNQIGVLSKADALARAKEQELDLVEIAANATPPVARIIDFKKFLYQMNKKKQDEHKKSKGSGTKEVRLGPFMSGNDLEVMIRRARVFLEESNKVKLVVRFKGPQMKHPEFGHKILSRSLELLSDIAKVERPPKFEGRNLTTIIVREKHKHYAKEENKTISQ